MRGAPGPRHGAHITLRRRDARHAGRPSLSVVASIHVPRRLGEEMDRLAGVNWSEEVGRSLEERVRELRRARALEEARRVIERLPEAPRGTAAGYVRGDRDGR